MRSIGKSGWTVSTTLELYTALAESSFPAMSVQGTSISLSGANIGAVDTGTTLIGGPADVIAKVYAAIPGATQMGGSYGGYYEYPCDTTIDFEITIGGFTIKITDADFNLGKYSSDDTMCTGAAFVQTLPSNAPVQWIIGDTVLKNVYSVYRYNPPAVGFANLANGLSDTGTQSSTYIPVISASAAVMSTNDTLPASTTASSTAFTSTTASSTASSAAASLQEPMVTVTTAVDANAALTSASSTPTQEERVRQHH